MSIPNPEDVRVDYIGLSVRSADALLKSGITTAGELQAKSDDDIQATLMSSMQPRLARSEFLQIKRRLARHFDASVPEIFRIGLHRFAARKLEADGVKTAEQLIKLSDLDILRTPNAGYRVLGQVKEWRLLVGLQTVTSPEEPVVCPVCQSVLPPRIKSTDA